MSVVTIRNALHIAPGQKVGLLGGSFDPPHMGHVHISKVARKKFGLDRVIWLVSPGNPLKTRPPAPIARRLQASRDILGPSPYFGASDIELLLDTRFTAETLNAISHAFPDVSFTWLMGADNLIQFHRWDRWRQIADTVPIGIIARPDQRVAARHSIAAKILAPHRIAERDSHMLGRMPAPAWCFVNCPMINLSSTQLRAAAKNRNGR